MGWVLLLLTGLAGASEALNGATPDAPISRGDQLWFAEAALEEIDDLTRRLSQAIEGEPRSRTAQRMRRRHEDMVATLESAMVSARALDSHSNQPEQAERAYRAICRELDRARMIYAETTATSSPPPRLVFPVQGRLEVPSGESDLWFEADTFSADVWSAGWWDEERDED